MATHIYCLILVLTLVFGAVKSIGRKAETIMRPEHISQQISTLHNLSIRE